MSASLEPISAGAGDAIAACARSLELLRCVPVLAGLDQQLLIALAAEVAFAPLAAGEWLFRAGDAASTAYVVASGRLEVVADSAEQRVLSVLRRGAVLGELALLRHDVRAASVRASRDSVLVSLDRAQFEALLRASPGFSLALLRELAEQLARASAPAAGGLRPRTLGLVALDRSVAGDRARQPLISALAGYGSVACLTEANAGDPENWTRALAAAEAAHDRVLLHAGDCSPEVAWTAFCARESDRVIALSGGDPDPGWHSRASLLHDCELVTVGARHRRAAVLERLSPSHVRAVSDDSGLRRVLREIGRRAAGRSVGVVLSGGGARAFAHLGVIEALHSSGIRIDRVGGVSLGAIVAATVARGDTPEAMCGAFRRYFVEQNPTSDYTLPLVSLIRGRKTERLLSEEFAGARIEELQLPFFCTSTDLLRRRLVVHSSGSLAAAVLASLSIPGVFPPASDGRDRLLVDGGVLDNLPVGVMAATAEGPVIAVDVTGIAPREAAGPKASARTAQGGALRRAITGSELPLPSLPDTIVRCMTLASADTVAAARRHADLVITPDVGGIGLLDWRRLPEMRAAGRAAAERALAEHPQMAERLCE